MHEQYRFLHANPTRPPTPVEYLAVKHEPEMISEHEQERQTAAAHRRDREQRIRAWRAAHGQISEAVTAFRASVPVRGPVSASLRSILRTADRVDREVTGGG